MDNITKIMEIRFNASMVFKINVAKIKNIHAYERNKLRRNLFVPTRAFIFKIKQIWI